MNGAAVPRSAVWQTVLQKGRTALRLLPTVLLYVVNAVWAIPAVLFMRVVRPWLHVRVARVHCERAGHFIADTSLYLAQHSVEHPGPRFVDFFWFPEDVSNEQWARMVRRQLSVLWWVRYVILFNRLIPGGRPHVVPFAKGSRDTLGWLQRSAARFEFTDAEHEQARSWLRRRGWQSGEPFVCLLVRDAAYLATHQAMPGTDPWSYHSYRDSDIADYVQAIHELLTRGQWVVRMGKTMRTRTHLGHPRFIDYPFVDDQDDLMDIWLAAHCSFFISTGTGIDMVPVVYGRPVVFVNFNPFNQIFSYAEQICVPKHLHWMATGRPLTLNDHCVHGYARASGYETAGIRITDLSPSEIAAAVDECARRLDGSWVDTADDLARQQRFWLALSSWTGFRDFHGAIHPHSRAGNAWLKSMGGTFLE